MNLQLGAPEPLTAAHRTDEFECGEGVLDEWLKRRVMANQLTGASRTFLVTDQGLRIHGYYAMAAGVLWWSVTRKVSSRICLSRRCWRSRTGWTR